MNRALLLGFAMAASTMGCWWSDGGDRVDDDDAPVVTPTEPAQIDVHVPAWPPIGPDHEVTVDIRAASGSALTRVEYSFLNGVTHTLGGSGTATDAVTGTELGEGLGTLEIVVWDNRGASSTRRVSDLLVDLSAPIILPGETILRHGADAELELYAADAWVLGSVQVSIGGVTREHAFEQGWPSTLGEDWDLSLVQFATGDFPEGEHPAVIVVRDAAGNETEQTLDVRLDGTPPSANITSPAPGSTVTGTFDVSVSGSDGGLPVWLTISVGGTPMATAVGPFATITLDASDLTPGATTLEVVAMDEAGNVSSSTSIPLLVE